MNTILPCVIVTISIMVATTSGAYAPLDVIPEAVELQGKAEEVDKMTPFDSSTISNNWSKTCRQCGYPCRPYCCNPGGSHSMCCSDGDYCYCCRP